MMVDKGAFLGRQHQNYCFRPRSKSKTLYLQLQGTKSRLDGCSSWFISQQSILSKVVTFLHCKGSCCSDMSVRSIHWVLQLGYLLTIHLDGGDAPPHMALHAFESLNALGGWKSYQILKVRFLRPWQPPLDCEFQFLHVAMSALFLKRRSRPSKWQKFPKNPDITDGLITKSSWPSSPCSITTSPQHRNKNETMKQGTLNAALHYGIIN